MEVVVIAFITQANPSVNSRTTNFTRTCRSWHPGSLRPGGFSSAAILRRHRSRATAPWSFSDRRSTVSATGSTPGWASPNGNRGRGSGSSTDLNLRSLRSFRLRLKIETNTREHFVLKGTVKRFFAVESRWWDGNASYRLSHLRKPSCEGRDTPTREAKVMLSSSSPRFTQVLGFFWGADEAPTAKGSAERSL